MSPSTSPSRITTLCSADGQALDALLARAADGSGPGADAGGFTAADDASRREKLAQVLALLDQLPADDPPVDLLERTLGRIEQHEQQQRLAMQIQALSVPAAAFQWRELAAVAAVILIGLSLAWPMLAHSREEARQVACQARLALAGGALGRYAADTQGQMPRLPAPPGTSWASVGLGPSTYANGRPVASNPANLYLLIRQGYINVADLSCPDNPAAPRRLPADAHDWPHVAAVSYSYQNQFTPQPLRLDRVPDLAVLADKNPLFAPSRIDPRRVVIRLDVSPSAASVLHQQRGQNVLQAGGQVAWQVQPTTPSGDNIWTARDQDVTRLDEVPSDPDDSMLIP